MRPRGALKPIIKASLLVLMVGALAFGLSIYSVFKQLDLAFALRETSLATRIYSDVTKITHAMPRDRVESRLQALGYDLVRQGDTTTFNFHPFDYPVDELVFDDKMKSHLQFNHPGGQVELSFDSGADRPLRMIKIAGEFEVSEIFLEPELIATWTRGAKEIREYVGFERINSYVTRALLAVEDQHFLEHKGFDPRGIARAVWTNLKNLRTRQGGSTITQQLVKNLTGRDERSVWRKFTEIWLALLLERKYTKQEILERYLNEVNLGQIGALEINGVVEGAKYFFGKPLDQVTLAEAALMAGLVKGPDYYSPYRHFDRAIERQKIVLRRMVETGLAAAEEVELASQEPIRLAPQQPAGSKAPYFTDFAKAELIEFLEGRMPEDEIFTSGLKVYTTVDMALNTAAQKVVASRIGELEKRLKLPPGIRIEGALASMDHERGHVRALIGGRSYAQSTFNRILNMKRQVGSTFKPIVYLAAYLKGKDPQGRPYAPGSPVEDAPWKLIYDRGKRDWQPRNYEKKHLGWITLRTALAHSVNTVAARLGVEVGIEDVIATARKLGIESELPAVPSLSLGVAELSPIELLRAYATIANQGLRPRITSLRLVIHPRGERWIVPAPFDEVIDPNAANLLTDTLQNVFTEGTAKSVNALGFVWDDAGRAGKTGTTSNYRDAWFAGYTPELTTVVWVGMDQDTEEARKVKINLTGGGSALPIWAGFMREATRGQAPSAFAQNKLIPVRIDRHTGYPARDGCAEEQTVLDKFVEGLEPKDPTCEPSWPASQRETTIQ